MTIDEFQFTYYLWELAHNIPVKISLILEISRAMTLKGAWGFKVFPQALKNSRAAILLNDSERSRKTHVSVSKKTNGLTILHVPDRKDIFMYWC